MMQLTSTGSLSPSALLQEPARSLYLLKPLSFEFLLIEHGRLSESEY